MAKQTKGSDILKPRQGATTLTKASRTATRSQKKTTMRALFRTVFGLHQYPIASTQMKYKSSEAECERMKEREKNLKK